MIVSDCAGWEFWYGPVGFSLGNSWRINNDCNDWRSIAAAILFVHLTQCMTQGHIHCSVDQGLYAYARPGGWNDPDMLVGSTPGSAVYNTKDQSRTQFSLWSILAAPLIIGSNMLGMSVCPTSASLEDIFRVMCIAGLGPGDIHQY